MAPSSTPARRGPATPPLPISASQATKAWLTPTPVPCSPTLAPSTSRGVGITDVRTTLQELGATNEQQGTLQVNSVFNNLGRNNTVMGAIFFGNNNDFTNGGRRQLDVVLTDQSRVRSAGGARCVCAATVQDPGASTAYGREPGRPLLAECVKPVCAQAAPASRRKVQRLRAHRTSSG